MPAPLEYQRFAREISFRFIQPFTVLPRGYSPFARLLDRLNLSLEITNTRLPEYEQAIKQALHPLCKIPKMSSFAIGALINQGVKSIELDEAFVNVGVWNGFTFLCGLLNNPDKRCIGIDNFSEFGGPRDAFLKRFQHCRSVRHEFYDQDYRDFFGTHSELKIGFYIYDGEHSYANQLRGLQLAEPYFSENCLILVDDTNVEAARQGTLDFMAQSRLEYRIIVDQKTCRNCHPTWWDGVMLLERSS